MKEEMEHEEPARGDKAEAIRRKYCLEDDQVYHANCNNSYDNIAFFKSTGDSGDLYLCFEYEEELQVIRHNEKVYYIHRVKE